MALATSVISARVQNAKELVSEWEQAFDTVLADVPCSGLGIIRKKPDIRFKDPKPLENLPKVQRDILENVFRYVKPGGVLIYSTCTVLERENETVVVDFLRDHSDFIPEEFELPAPVGSSENGMYTFWPHRENTDGFFVAKLRRREP